MVERKEDSAPPSQSMNVPLLLPIDVAFRPAPKLFVPARHLRNLPEAIPGRLTAPPPKEELPPVQSMKTPLAS
jgi:hypothetical protein